MARAIASERRSATSSWGPRHILASAEHFMRTPVANADRPYGPGNYVLTGSGTLANPFTSNPEHRAC